MRDAGRMALPENGLRTIVALQAFEHADELDAWVSSVFSSRWGNDPTTQAAPDGGWSGLYLQTQNQRPAALENLDHLLRELSQEFGNVTRAVWRRLQ